MSNRVVFSLLAGMALCVAAPAGDNRHQSFLSQLPAAPAFSASTVPSNGDINPYGVAFVPQGFPADGILQPGDILVSNFNNSNNAQGTGTTIVRITPQGHASLFFQGQSGLGLTTALGVLRRGFVLVGNTPTNDGTCATVQQGSLLVLDRNGKQVGSLADPALLDGPWDLTIRDHGNEAQLYVSGVLNGVVARFDLSVPDQNGAIGTAFVRRSTQIASGYLHRCDPAALVVGPTGLTLDSDHDLLYVASTGDNAIFSVANPAALGTTSGMGNLVYQDNAHLRGPLALVLAPNGNLITANGDAVNGDPAQPSEMVEFTPAGQFVAQRPVNATAQGGAFGLALTRVGDEFRFAAVDDVLNVLDLWIVRRD
jgi:hypothetical protein